MGIRPNHVTFFWTVLGLGAVVALASWNYRFRVAGACLLQLSYLLDFVDGEVARLQKRSSKRGVFLDLAGHGVIKTALFLSLGYRLFISAGSSGYLLLAFCACVSISSGHALPSYAARCPVRNKPALSHAPPIGKSTIRKWLGLTSYLFESPGLYGSVLVGATIDRLNWVVLFYGFFGPLWLVFREAEYRYE